ncbi:MAG: (Fe-S)-binding protein [Acidimicrobiia bacterium]
MLQLPEDELVACVACGLCLPACPTYRVTGREIASPRGRIAAMQAVQLGGAPIDDEFISAMDACLVCRGCEVACPSGVRFGHLMEGARSAIQPHRSASRRMVEWLGYRVVLPHHGLLLVLTWLLAVAQRLRLVPRRFGLPRISFESLRTPLEADTDPDAVLFTGCVMDAWQREVHRAAMTVMRSAGARPGLPGPRAACCGALHLHAGLDDQARTLAQQVIASFPSNGPIVVDSAGCGAAMKDYGRLLDTDTARAFSDRVHDFSEWLAGQDPQPLRATGATVVIQDPCHLRHVQHGEQAVRTVLREGYRLVELADDGLCCGAGGAYSVTEPELATAVRDRKVRAIHAAAGDGPFVVASANPGCAMHLAAAGLTVKHPAELIQEALS